MLKDCSLNFSPPSSRQTPTSRVRTIIMTAYMVSRARVGCSPCSMSELIMRTSRLMTENVRIIVP